jgi:hypothetical protein
LRGTRPISAELPAQDPELRVCPDSLFFKVAIRLASGIASLALLLFSGTASAVDDSWFFLRNHNPFLQVYGLPPFQTASLADEGELQYRATFDVANHADSGELQNETVIIDGESYFFTLSVRHGLKRWLEVGFDLPVVRHSGGMFDNAIERWHKIWGLSNSERVRPSNQLLFRYARQGLAPYEMSSSVSGLGDLQLTAAIPLITGQGSDGRAISLRSSLKLPTGDEQKLLGSGASDFSLGLYASDAGVFGWRDLSLSGFAGLLLLGKGEIFPEIQERTVAFGGFAAAWQATDKFSLAAQIYAQDKYLQSELEDIGGNSVQATFGGTYFFSNHGISLSFALAEDLLTETISDVAFHVSVRWHGGKRKAVPQ